jgi:pyruvate dehydrogenase E1 component
LRGPATAARSHLERLVRDDERGLPVVTVIDGASHALSFVGAALGARSVPLGVDEFGQTGSQPEVYAAYEIDAAAIATAALVALEP